MQHALQSRSLCPPNIELVYTFHTRHLTSNACLTLNMKVLFTQTHREFKIEKESIFPRLKKLGFHEEGGRLYPTRKSKRASFFWKALELSERTEETSVNYIFSVRAQGCNQLYINI